MHRRPLLDMLARYRAVFPAEGEMIDRISALVESCSECFHRTCRPGHITGAAWIISADHRRCLLTHHRKLDRWLQLGGHADGQWHVEDVALREAREEARRGEGAFVPFLMLGDPDPSSCLAAARSLIAAGVDALELGLPFSDPIADGPVIQAAATRALRAGVRRRDCWRIVKELRAGHPDLPIGLLVYANLVCHRDPAVFYREAAEAGVDSVLIADLPIGKYAAGFGLPSIRRSCQWRGRQRA